ncbi:MAG: ornithine carbamoyltransferase [Candidatus Asgardarchaeia archaeon]
MTYVDLLGKDLITTQEWTREELDFTLEVAKDLKRKFYTGSLPEILKNKTFFMLFYNTSTRTRASFEAAMTALGGHAQFIDVSTTRAGEGEAAKDIARVYERYGHGLGIRILEKAVNYVYGAGNALIREYAKWAKIPVINMADDKFHPAQGLTDIMTVQEKFPRFENKKYVIMWAYAAPSIRSWGSIQEEMLIMTRYGLDVTLAFPPGFDPDPQVIEWAKQNADQYGGSLEISHDYKEALEGANIVFPRGWASNKFVMEIAPKAAKEGAEAMKKAKEAEIELHNKYKDWRLTMDLVDRMAKNKMIMHVLPVFRGREADDDVMDSEYSAIFDQAENRLHAQMGILAVTMGGKY